MVQIARDQRNPARTITSQRESMEQDQTRRDSLLVSDACFMLIYLATAQPRPGNLLGR